MALARVEFLSLSSACLVASVRLINVHFVLCHRFCPLLLLQLYLQPMLLLTAVYSDHRRSLPRVSFRVSHLVVRRRPRTRWFSIIIALTSLLKVSSSGPDSSALSVSGPERVARSGHGPKTHKSAFCFLCHY